MAWVGETTPALRFASSASDFAQRAGWGSQRFSQTLSRSRSLDWSERACAGCPPGPEATLETGFTRRNAARMARPTTTIPMIVVTARRVSQPAVDVTSE